MLTLVPFGSDLYRATLAFRDLHLRRPLGLQLSAADCDGEDGQIHLALVDDGAVRGTVVLKPEADDVVTLRQMAIDPGLRGQGAGRDLITYAETVARDHGVRRITMHARVSARPFYERLGYRAEGTEFIDVTLPHIVMARDL